MTEPAQSIYCDNCSFTLEQPTVIADGKSYCCSGCSRGGPCICSYADAGPSSESGKDDGESDCSGLGDFFVAPADLPSSSVNFAQVVENVLKEVEITQQVVKDQAGSVKDLLGLLQRTAKLLLITTYQLEERKHAQSSEWVSRVLSEAPKQEQWEDVKLVVENATEFDITLGYTKALAGLDSVRELKLVSMNGSNLHYRVQTISKAKFTREVMSLPGYRPRRTNSTPDSLTVQLDVRPGTLQNDDDLLAFKTMEPFADPAGQANTKASAGSGPFKGNQGFGVLEVGVEGFFNARHFLVKDGAPGPIEMKSWRVEISLEGEQSGDDGQVSGIHQAEEAVGRILTSYNNKLLNKMEPYTEIPPTPENIARTLHEQVGAAIVDLPLRLKGLKVWASPTQYVWYSESPGHAP